VIASDALDADAYPWKLGSILTAPDLSNT